MQAAHKPRFVSCMDCERSIIPSAKDAPLLCPSCQDRADEAQRDHQIREAAHDMLEALEQVDRAYCLQLDKKTTAKMKAAIAKARGRCG